MINLYRIIINILTYILIALPIISTIAIVYGIHISNNYIIAGSTIGYIIFVIFVIYMLKDGCVG